MHIVISDDHQDCIRHLSCFEKLKGHTVEIFNNSVSGTDALAERYKNAEAIVLIRERTVITRELLDRLPKLKVISQTGKMASHVDLQACKDKLESEIANLAKISGSGFMKANLDGLFE